MNGKGDKPRPTDRKKYEESYERIFGKHYEGKFTPSHEIAKDITARAHVLTFVAYKN